MDAWCTKVQLFFTEVLCVILTPLLLLSSLNESVPELLEFIRFVILFKTKN